MKKTFVLVLTALLLVALVWILWPRHELLDENSAAASTTANPSPAPSAIANPKLPIAPAAPPAEISHLADDLNAPHGNIRRDLEILGELFEAWQTNFPHTGNPVGENAEITTALIGGNPLHFAFLPRSHPAIDARGELCDRWGTPFFFHQLSGQSMGIRSAGPDKKMWSDDDITSPAPAAP